MGLDKFLVNMAGSMAGGERKRTVYSSSAYKPKTDQQQKRDATIAGTTLLAGVGVKAGIGLYKSGRDMARAMQKPEDAPALEFELTPEVIADMYLTEYKVEPYLDAVVKQSILAADRTTGPSALAFSTAMDKVAVMTVYTPEVDIDVTRRVKAPFTLYSTPVVGTDNIRYTSESTENVDVEILEKSNKIVSNETKSGVWIYIRMPSSNVCG